MTKFWNLEPHNILLGHREIGVSSLDMSENGENKRDNRTQGGSSNSQGEGLDADIQRQIGKRLKEYFNSVIDEPIPDRFIELLNRLEAEKKKK